MSGHINLAGIAAANSLGEGRKHKITVVGSGNWYVDLVLPTPHAADK